MKSFCRLAFAFLCLQTIMPAWAASADEQKNMLMRSGHLQCGQAKVTSHTLYWDAPQASRQVLSQRLVLKHPDSKHETTLQHDGVLSAISSRGLRTLDAYITGWTCLDKDDKHYLYVLYFAPRLSAKAREWPRVFDEYGNLLTTDKAHSDKQYTATMKRLDLAANLKKGIPLRDINE